MNETIQTILGRRSIRDYQSGQIGEEELQEILLAGQYAAAVFGYSALPLPEAAPRKSDVVNFVR